MKLGIAFFPTETSIQPAELAREAEERGFESLLFAEHTHIPITRRTRHPHFNTLSPEYCRTYAPLVALAAAAVATDRILLGTGVCVVVQRDPIHLAKEVATLDQVSRGRLLFGIGYGWNVDEMTDHGVDPGKRHATTREKVLAMKELWTRDEPSFDGEHVAFPPCWFWPKPLQTPHPPILIGARAGPTVLRHVVEFGDGWMPVGIGGLTKGLQDLKEEAIRQGRDRNTIEVGVFGARADAGVLDHYCDLGVKRAVLSLPSAPGDDVRRVLDSYTRFFDSVGIESNG